MAAPLVLLVLLAAALGGCGAQQPQPQPLYPEPEAGEEPPGEPARPPDTLHLAGLFYEDEWQEIMAFKAAIERVNMDKVVLPDVKLVPVVEVLESTDGFSLSKKLCALTAQGIAAIFGPSRSENINIVSSISEALEIPHILTRYSAHKRPTKVRVNIAPDRTSVSKAITDLLDDMAWKTFTIVYEDDEGLFRLQEVLKAHGPADSPVTVRRLGEDPDYRPLLKDILNSTESRIILDVAADRLLDIFRQARQVNMMGDYVSFLVTSLDAHTLDWSEVAAWAPAVSNVTGLRLVDSDSNEVQNALQDWLYSERLRGTHVNLAANEIKASSALINDAVHMFARALHQLNQTSPAVFEEPLSCDGANPWQHGERIVSYMKAKYSSGELEERGMTGPLSLSAEDDYRRVNFTVTLIDTMSNNATGVWNASGIHLFRSVEEMERSTKEMLQKKVMRVVSKIGRPYLMKKENWTEGMGNEGLRGYSLDLIAAIAEDIGFKFEFYLVADGQYGSLKNGQWNGIIKDLLDRKADLGICDLTITYDRERAVDFTMPFMTLGISILHTIPKQEPPNLFSFLEPFSTEVWFYMAFAYLGVSVLLFVLARLTPYEWESTSPNDEEGGVLEFTLNLANAIWHNVGSIMQQGSDIAPKAPSTRMVAGMWWFFTLIMISSYTANLAAFLTASAQEGTINSAKDLVQQTKIQYGCVKGGSTMSFFANSNFSDYQRMWDVMSNAKPSVFPAGNAEGVERVQVSEGQYAFLMESTNIEYEAARKCELRQVGGLLDSKGYGVALPRNSPYRGLISGSVLHLQETGKLTQLKDLWWHQLDDGNYCSSQQTDQADDSGGKLDMANVGGVFLVLIYGCVAAFFMAIIEFIWNSRTVAIENKIGFGSALVKELKFAVRCSASTKPVRYAASSGSGRSSPSSRSARSSLRSSASPGLTRRTTRASAAR